MRPPATKGNKKKDKLGHKIEDKTSGRHTIQHQGGHLKKALRTPNSTLFKKMHHQTIWKTNWETSWETRETKPREGGHTIKHRETRRETMGD